MKITIKLILYLLYYTYVNNSIITIDKLIAGGDGLGYIDGKAHFIPGVLPGEVVEIEITENKKGFNRCEVTKILEPSQFRETPFCPIYEECGGCNLQYTSYENQLKLKKQIVMDIFRRNGNTDLEDFDIIHGNPLAYRNRVQLHVNDEICGFKKKNSNEIVEVKDCPLLVDGLNSHLKKTNFLSAGRKTLFSYKDETYEGGKDRECSIEINGKIISFNPSGFFQSNLSLLPELINCVNKYINGSSVMDLYCGIGLFSIFLPESVNKIVAVELDDRVEPFVNKNLEGRNFKFYPMSLESYIKKGLHKKNIVDTIIVDPPRKGLSKEVRKFLSNSNVKRIIYVSCDPVTMARDISVLNDSGYNLSYFSCLDFYPYTSHIEAFGVLDLE